MKEIEKEKDLRKLIKGLPAWANWLAMDLSGGVYFHVEKPQKALYCWHSNYYKSLIPGHLIPLSYNGLDWSDSLIEIKR